MTNPFEDEQAEYYVLMNDEGQYSLWPVSIPVPPGWTVTGPRGKRQTCLDYIDASWSDMRPNSLVAAMEEDAVRRAQQ